MSRTMSRPDGDGEATQLGALLRLAHQAMSVELAQWLSASTWSDLQPAHCAAIHALWRNHEGARLTALAQRARVTKQSMGALIEHLSRGGYVERIADPDDGRAFRLRLTARGRAFAREVRAFARGVEASWAERVGTRRIRELRETLTLLVGDGRGAAGSPFDDDAREPTRTR